MMQNLERNWPAVSTLTWGIWGILTRALRSLKNLHFNGLFFWPKYIMFEPKSTKELSFMALKSDAKLEEKLTCGLENDRRNSANFHQNTLNSRNWSFDGILLSKVQAVRSGVAVGSSAPPSKFLSMCPFLRRALKVPFLKEVTKNVHENEYSIRES